MSVDQYPYIRTLLAAQIKRLGVRSIYDVGAYTGGTSLALATMFRKVTVRGIEPHPANCAALRLAVQRYRLQNYHVHELAISDKVDAYRLTYYTQDGEVTQAACAEALADNKETARSVIVQTTSFAAFCRAHGEPEMLLLNCEGEEFRIFKASRDIIGRVKVLDLSMHGKSFRFTSEEYSRHKVLINEDLAAYGFELLYGELLTNCERVPRGHIRQVWSRS